MTPIPEKCEHDVSTPYILFVSSINRHKTGAEGQPCRLCLAIFPGSPRLGLIAAKKPTKVHMFWETQILQPRPRVQTPDGLEGS